MKKIDSLKKVRDKMKINLKSKKLGLGLIEVIISVILLSVFLVIMLNSITSHTVFLSQGKNMTINNYQIDSTLEEVNAELRVLSDSGKTLAAKQAELLRLKTDNELNTLDYKEFDIFENYAGGKYKSKIKGYYVEKNYESREGKKAMLFSPMMRLDLKSHHIPALASLTTICETKYEPASNKTGIPSWRKNEESVKTENPLYFYINSGHFSDKLKLVATEKVDAGTFTNEYSWYVTKKDAIFKPFFAVYSEGMIIDHQAENIGKGFPTNDDFQKISGLNMDSTTADIIANKLYNPDPNLAIKHDVYIQAKAKPKTQDPTIEDAVKEVETCKIYGINIPNTYFMLNHLSAPITYGMRRFEQEDGDINYIANLLDVISRKSSQHNAINDDYFKIVYADGIDPNDKLGYNDAKDGFAISAGKSIKYQVNNMNLLKDGYMTYCIVLDDLDNDTVGPIFTKLLEQKYRIQLYKDGYNSLVLKQGGYKIFPSSRFKVWLNAKEGKNYLIVTESETKVHYSFNGQPIISKRTKEQMNYYTNHHAAEFGASERYPSDASFSLIEYASFYGNNLDRMQELVDYFKAQYQ